jgi:hypothetical protein
MNFFSFFIFFGHSVTERLTIPYAEVRQKPSSTLSSHLSHQKAQKKKKAHGIAMAKWLGKWVVPSLSRIYYVILDSFAFVFTQSGSLPI